MGIGKTLVESTVEIEDCNWETNKEIIIRKTTINGC